MIQYSDYHAKYFAYELTRRYASDSLEKIGEAVASAQVELNPHQVDAALFAFQSPLSKGALLADEVGLGKTIEAGLVISQRWAERKRHILVITPANLRKQWHQELTEKFFLPCTILESKSYNQKVRQSELQPFQSTDSIMICSYQFARSKAADVQMLPWDLVVMDEAHRLRNVYKTSNVIANTLKKALANRHKLLLTATPLQNSLLELYGLFSFIDEHVFGDLRSFREQYANLNDKRIFENLKKRIQPLCQRALRRQVTGFVRYTKRYPIVEKFSPEDREDLLYHRVSDYLRRENLQALPTGQRSLMTLVLRKLLASSTFAIAGALETIRERLKAKLQRAEPEQMLLFDSLSEDFEAIDEVVEEWGEEDEIAPLSPAEIETLRQEITDLDSFHELAVSISYNAKGKALLRGLERAFAEAERLGAPRKAIIFTESRRTQEYLLRLLAESQFSQGIVLFNGSNGDAGSRAIYNEWLARHQGSDRVTGSRTADMRSALVDYFRDEGQIMIATEAGAEGINLQFCSLVVNYDLPWNPQRIEQRIGRCHRYGQKHDVVVVNFLNTKNEANQRVFELLAEKFLLFQGVFGASDEVLGAIESGVDFEKRIAGIYQNCRTSQEIQASFDQLQRELSSQINEVMTQTRQLLLENFDVEVQEKLRIRQSATEDYLNRFEHMLMDLTHYELNEHAEFVDGHNSFVLRSNPFGSNFPTTGEVALGRYELPRRTGDAHLYRISHPLAQAVLHQAKQQSLPSAEITFDYSGQLPKIAAIAPYVGKTGTMVVNYFTIASLDQVEDHLLLAAMTDGGEILEEEAARRFFSLGAAAIIPSEKGSFDYRLQEIINQQQDTIRRQISQRNLSFFEAESVKLDGWADDLKVALERDIKEIDRQIKEARRSATLALTLEDKLAGQREIKALEVQRNSKRRTLFDAQDEIDQRREELIGAIEGKLQQETATEQLFHIGWRLL